MINVVIVKLRPSGKTSARQNATFEGVPRIGDRVDDWVVEGIHWSKFAGRGAYTPHIILKPFHSDQPLVNNGHR